MSFSAHTRPERLRAIQDESFDLLIIGGGITGVGIALDAATRGLKTVLIEKNDFAFGTSSRSTKLIHGGLRYLKQLEFALVKEVGSERAIVHNLVPHLVVPEKMLLPLYERRGLGYWLASVGLMIYDWLAGVKPEDQRRMLTKPQTLRHEPLLKPDDIKGGALYAEYRTDDARLTIEIAKEAHVKGALLINYLAVTDFRYGNGQVQGVEVRDVISGATMSIRARSVVNAAGPWVDDLREINHSRKDKHLHLTKGVHVVVPYHRMPVRQAIYFDVPDGRMIFAIPRGRITYIGTTDTDYSGSKEDVYATREDVKYILDAVNETFPTVHLTLADVESCWAGLRPLIHEEGKSASELSRKDEIFESESGLISIAGGKLTGYRKMAERVVDLLARKKFADRLLPSCSTASIRLAGGGFKSVAEVQIFNKAIAGRMETMGLKGDEGTYLVHLFGRQAGDIIEEAAQVKDQDPDVALLLSALRYCIRNEMVVKASDFLVRRKGLLYFNLHRLLKFKEPVLLEMASQFNWSAERIAVERNEMEELIKQTLQFKS
ncbi:MAG TPA: glycerol-3-phosphate dehydrogenase/oxidase [Cyclobacteriaceae bacterium]|nr:glycerol-3-phosphate dehydrogenase/oxidase [Cyclobacteriaceae bacterium]